MRGNMKSPKSGVSDVHGLARRHVSLDSQLTVKATGLGVLWLPTPQHLKRLSAKAQHHHYLPFVLYIVCTLIAQLVHLARLS